MQSILNEIEGIEIIPVTHINEVFDIALKKNYIAESIDQLLQSISQKKKAYNKFEASLCRIIGKAVLYFLIQTFLWNNKSDDQPVVRHHVRHKIINTLKLFKVLFSSFDCCWDRK